MDRSYHKGKQSWLRELRLLDDEPITDYRNHDLLGFTSHVEMVAGALREAHGPMVIHVDGQWGRGKSTFCRMLENCLAARPDENNPDDTQSNSDKLHDVTTSWFVASDRNADMVDGILHAVARAVTRGDPEETLRILRKWGQNSQKNNTGATELAARMSQFHEWVAHELGWIDDRPNTGEGGEPKPVTVELGGDKLILAQRTIKRRLALIFVDDLDRCTPKNARAVMDAVQQFVNCKGVAFIIAADRAVLDVAFKASVQEYVGLKRLGATQALEKYIRHRVQLPGIDVLIRSPRLNHRLHNLQEQLLPRGTQLLKGRGAYLESGIAVLLARSFPATMTVRRLKRILNDLAATLAEAADRHQLGPAELEQLPPAKQNPRPWFDQQKPSRRADYESYFLGQVAIITARHVWPTLHQVWRRDTEKFANTASALAAIGQGLSWWPVALLRTTLEGLVVSDEGEFDHTPFSTKKEMCLFLHRVYALADPPRGVHPAHEDIEQAPEDVVESKGSGARRAVDAYNRKVTKKQTPQPPEEDVQARSLRKPDVPVAQQAVDAGDHEEVNKPVSAPPQQDAQAKSVRGPDLPVAPRAVAADSREEENKHTSPPPQQNTQARNVRSVRSVREPVTRGAEEQSTRLLRPKSGQTKRVTYRGPAPKSVVEEGESVELQEELQEEAVEELLSFSDAHAGDADGEQAAESDDVITKVPADFEDFLNDFWEEVSLEPSRPSLKNLNLLCRVVRHAVDWQSLNKHIDRINELGWKLAEHGHRSVFQAVMERAERLDVDSMIRWSYPGARFLITQKDYDAISPTLVELYIECTRTKEYGIFPPRLLRLLYQTERHQIPANRLVEAIDSILLSPEHQAPVEALLIAKAVGIEPPSLLYKMALFEGESTPSYPWEQVDYMAPAQFYELLGELCLKHSKDPTTLQSARACFDRLQGSEAWTPKLIHIVAHLCLVTNRTGPAGQYWELAYAAGYRAPEMRRAFADLLFQQQKPDAAKRVIRGQRLGAPLFWRSLSLREALTKVQKLPGRDEAES